MSERYDLNRLIAHCDEALAPLRHLADDRVPTFDRTLRQAVDFLTSLREVLILVGPEVVDVSEYDGRWDQLARIAKSVLEVPEAAA